MSYKKQTFKVGTWCLDMYGNRLFGKCKMPELFERDSASCQDRHVVALKIFSSSLRLKIKQKCQNVIKYTLQKCSS